MASHWEILSGGGVVVSNTAEDLWHNAEKYFKWCDENPIVTEKKITAGKEAGKSYEVISARPYTIKGLCLHCGILEEYLRDIRGTKDKSSKYYHIISRILYVIYIQNLEQGLIGNYSPIMVAKLLGMEREEIPTGSVKVEIIGGLPELSNSENQILEKLELEIAEKEKGKEKNF